MKIAYFITGLGLGGAEVVTIDIANEMARRGNEVLFLYLTGENAHKSKFLPQIDVVGLGMQKTPTGLIKALFKTKKIMKKFAPDVVHANMIHANLFVRFLRLIIPLKRVVSTEHNKNIEGSLRMKAYQWTNSLSDFNTNVSKEAVDFFIEQGAFKAANSSVMYNGIPFKRYNRDEQKVSEIRQKYGICEDDFLFINLGRLTEAKDHVNLLTAFSKLESGKLMILGQGDLFDMLQNKIKELGIGDRTILAGAHPNVGDYYSAADSFVLSSAWEGLPMVILEAMSYKLPIVTTDVGGARETVGDERWIVESKNSEKLATKMSEMMNLNEEERKKIGTRNRAKASEFDIETICDNWIKIYQKSDL